MAKTYNPMALKRPTLAVRVFHIIDEIDPQYTTTIAFKEADSITAFKAEERKAELLDKFFGPNAIDFICGGEAVEVPKTIFELAATLETLQPDKDDMPDPVDGNEPEWYSAEELVGIAIGLPNTWYQICLSSNQVKSEKKA